MTEAVFCYVTCPSRNEALAIARALVDERLAAGGNVLPGVASVYRWEGAVREAEEVVLILKTQARLGQRVVERVRALHSYACPCVVLLPLAGGNPAYLDWIRAETSEGDRGERA
jgi:periplasmic divalent cation tolerance protein